MFAGLSEARPLLDKPLTLFGPFELRAVQSKMQTIFKNNNYFLDFQESRK